MALGQWEPHPFYLRCLGASATYLHTGSLLGQSCFGDFGNEKDSVIFSQMRAPISIEALDSLDWTMRRYLRILSSLPVTRDYKHDAYNRFTIAGDETESLASYHRSHRCYGQPSSAEALETRTWFHPCINVGSLVWYPLRSDLHDLCGALTIRLMLVSIHPRVFRTGVPQDRLNSSQWVSFWK